MNEINQASRSAGRSHLLNGAVALVTGGSRGIGKAIALKLATMGASVAICGRDEAALAVTVNELKEFGGQVCARRADVAESKDVTELVEKTGRELGPITILVNNAGIGVFGPAHEKTEEDWDRVLNTNLKSVFLVSQAVALTI